MRTLNDAERSLAAAKTEKEKLKENLAKAEQRLRQLDPQDDDGSSAVAEVLEEEDGLPSQAAQHSGEAGAAVERATAGEESGPRTARGS